MDDVWRKVVALDVVDGDDGRAVVEEVQVVVVQATVDEHCVYRKKTDNCHGRTRHYLRSC